MPLVLSLHGAGGDAQHGLDLLRPVAETAGFAVLAPSSERQTWDVIAGEFGTDVSAITDALIWTGERYNIRADCVAAAGFSDGASYALSLGLSSGDLLRYVLAFSPGFFRVLEPCGRPKIYISHGKRDSVLPIDPCSRRIAPQLKRAGYDVTYREFEGGHAVPDEQRREAVNLFLGNTAGIR